MNNLSCTGVQIDYIVRALQFEPAAFYSIFEVLNENSLKWPLGKRRRRIGVIELKTVTRKMLVRLIKACRQHSSLAAEFEIDD